MTPDQILDTTRNTAKDVFKGSCSSAFEAIEFTIEEGKANFREAAQAQAVPGDIRALKYRIHELEGEVMGYKRILDGQGKAEPVAITHVGAMDHGPFEITPTAHGCDHLKHGDKLYTQAAAEPYAYCVYFPTEQRQEYCQDLDELCEDLTNLEHEITPLYTTPPATQAALTAALEALRELASCGAEAWSADRPCVKDGYAAIAQIEALKGPAP